MQIPQILSDLAAVSQTYGSKVEEAMAGDLSNPESLLMVQYELSNYSQMIQLRSTFTKKIDDMISGVIAKL